LRIAQREYAIEQEWRENFRQMGYDEEQIKIGIHKYRQENRERYEVSRRNTDPEGVARRSDIERAQKETKVAEDFLGIEPAKNTNPEGVPAEDRGNGQGQPS
jgi:hypothetical protein